MNNKRLLALVLKKPEARAPKPVYAPVPLFGMKVTDRIAEWLTKVDAREFERNRADCIARSLNCKKESK